MKTLKLITLSFLFAAFATVAMANSIVNKNIISTNDDLRKAIKEKVESNLAESFNFLDEMGVRKLQENVEINFIITPDQTLKILSIICKNSIATEYVRQVLNKEKLNVTGFFTDKSFKVNLNLSYRAS
jgi:hypothetical protein